MPSTRFIIVRHGETEWNLQEREMGHLDSPLTALGLAQAFKLGVRLARSEIHHIYSSDLPRAARTAYLIAEQTGHPVNLDARLRERNMGIFEGLTRSERDARFPKERAAFRHGFDYVIPRGESAQQRLERSLACLEELAQKHAGQVLLLVTHGGVLMGIFEHVLGIPFGTARKFHVANAAVNLFTHGPTGWILETWGDVTHLMT